MTAPNPSIVPGSDPDPNNPTPPAEPAAPPVDPNAPPGPTGDLRDVQDALYGGAPPTPPDPAAPPPDPAAPPVAPVGDPPPAEPPAPPASGEPTFAPDTGYAAFKYSDTAKAMIDADEVTKFGELAKGLNGGKGIGQDDAQALVGWVDTFVSGMVNGAEATRAEWMTQSEAHPLYGGSKAEQTDTHIKALCQLADNNAIAANDKPSQGLFKALETSGMIKHPAVRALLAFAGDQLLAEPGAPLGDPSPTPADAGDISTAAGRAKVWYNKNKS